MAFRISKRLFDSLHQRQLAACKMSNVFVQASRRLLSTVSLQCLKYRFIWHGGVEIDLDQVHDSSILQPANFDSTLTGLLE